MIHLRRRGVIASAGFSPIVATGGDEVDDVTIDGVLYRVHQFTTVGSSSFAVESLGSTDGQIEYLVVAGGGSGGTSTLSGNRDSGGGGGAGGFLNGNTFVTEANFSVFVGNGGPQITSTLTQGTDGANSFFNSIVATGGGGGGAGSGGNNNGRNGGSGGGTGRRIPGGQPSAGLGISGQGHNGARRTDDSNAAVGGGGAGGPGVDNDVNGGGPGVSSNITGVAVIYAAGTGGGTGGTGPPGGREPQPNNSGNGGLGGSAARSAGADRLRSGAGGSGIVVIRYPLKAAA